MTWIDLAAIDPLTSRIIGCGVEVHRRLGPGLLESVYHVCLAFELRNSGLTVVENMRVPVSYKDLRFEAQLLTYLRLTNRPVGLLMNFNVPILKEGIRRRVNPGTSVPPSL